MLEVRLREHDAVVDVFVPIEGTHTHSGSPKPLHWRDNLSSEPRFARFLPRIRGHVANLTLSPSDLETLSDKEAAQIVASYDTTGEGGMRYQKLVEDVCEGVPHFIESADDPDVASHANLASTTAPTPEQETEDELMMQTLSLIHI